MQLRAMHGSASILKHGRFKSKIQISVLMHVCILTLKAKPASKVGEICLRLLADHLGCYRVQAPGNIDCWRSMWTLAWVL
jgi:hypothetical protein